MRPGDLRLKSITIKGYKSIDSVAGASLAFENVTVLLGANGVGKSNLVSFFTMLNYMMTGSLQIFIAEGGYADSFLFFGAKKTKEIVASIEFVNPIYNYKYEFRLAQAVGDTLIFTDEKLIYQEIGNSDRIVWQLNPGVRETDLLNFMVRSAEKIASKQYIDATIVSYLLRNCKVFHFHDTSTTASIRGQGYLEDNQYLNNDGDNLAAFLYRLKNNTATFVYYTKIVRYIQKVMPQFGDFDLNKNELNARYITLNWRDKTNQHLFGPHQISDGSLRFMALATLLLQPKELLPNVIILDEPELGLHPSAIAYLAGMIKATSMDAQIIIATQSPRLMDEFDLENIVVVERDKKSNSSTFEYKNSDDLKIWLNEYSLSELWEKNVIGGQP